EPQAESPDQLSGSGARHPRLRTAGDLDVAGGPRSPAAAQAGRLRGQCAGEPPAAGASARSSQCVGRYTSSGYAIIISSTCRRGGTGLFGGCPKPLTQFTFFSAGARNQVAGRTSHARAVWADNARSSYP